MMVSLMCSTRLVWVFALKRQPMISKSPERIKIITVRPVIKELLVQLAVEFIKNRSYQ